jgi:hypothetical protein
MIRRRSSPHRHQGTVAVQPVKVMLDRLRVGLDRAQSFLTAALFRSSKVEYLQRMACSNTPRDAG